MDTLPKILVGLIVLGILVMGGFLRPGLAAKEPAPAVPVSTIPAGNADHVSPATEPVAVKQAAPAIIPTTTIHRIPPVSHEVRDPADPSYFIRMDPVADFETNSSLMITGSTKLNMTITTNYPEGSLFFFDIVNEDSGDHLLTKTDIRPAVAGTGGLNTSSFSLDAGVLPIGHYRAVATRGVTDTTVSVGFNVTPPGLWTWIWTDPVSPVHEGDMLTITGTTNLDPGCNVTIDTMEVLFPERCNPPLPPGYPRDTTTTHDTRWCGYGNCIGFPDAETVIVSPGTGGKNTWRATINTSGWCWQGYQFKTSVDTWTNVTGEGAVFNVSPPDYPAGVKPILTYSATGSDVSRENVFWIYSTPDQNYTIGEPLVVTGTTNLPPGTEISIIPREIVHPCPPDPSGTEPHYLCNYNCGNAPLRDGTATVVRGTDGTDSWTYVFTTDDWCRDIKYSMTATVNNRTNVTPAHVTFRSV